MNMECKKKSDIGIMFLTQCTKSRIWDFFTFLYVLRDHGTYLQGGLRRYFDTNNFLFGIGCFLYRKTHPFPLQIRKTCSAN